MINALVVSGGGFSGLSIIKGLLKSDKVRTILIDCYEENIGRYFVDAFYRAPLLRHENEFLDFLKMVCEKESIDIIFPSMEYELSLLASQVENFRTENIHIAVSSSDLLNKLQNKRLLQKFLIAEGLPAIPEVTVSNENNLPVLGKPVFGFGGKGFIEIHQQGDLKDYDLLKLNEQYIFQPLLRDFEEFSIDFAITSTSHVSDPVIRKRNRTSGGFAVISESIFDDEIVNLANLLVSKIVRHGAVGLFNFQIIRTASAVYISDINPRAGTSMVFTYGVGVNLPLFFCSSIDERFLSYGFIPSSHNKKMVMVRYLDELYYIKESVCDVKGVVFDLDDTLLDQKRWIMAKFEILWENYSQIFPRKADFLLTVLWLIEEGNRSNTIDALCELFSLGEQFRAALIDGYRKAEPDTGCLYPDSVPTLIELKKRGYKLALITDNPPASQKQKIRTNRLESYFDAISFTREYGKEKPDKEAFQAVAGELCINPSNLAMVGDNLYRDVTGAERAGIPLRYLICREGAFFNFSEQHFINLQKISYRKIKSLRELLWELK